MYPNSEYFADANSALKKLSDKIEKKVYENAKGYNTISDYKAAMVALDNFVADYPGTTFKEDALFYKFDSAYKLAINSIPAKMQERLNAAKIAQANLVKFNASTKYKSLSDQMLVRIEKDLQKFTN
jgi:outer membrane protein assembly factor BamD